MAITINDWMVYMPIVLIIIVAIMSYLVTRTAVSSEGWYQYIKKAPLSPPNWIFGFVWILLYIFIAIVWARANYYFQPGAKHPPGYTSEQANKVYNYINVLFVINIVLNLAWSFLFFGDGNFVAAFIIILLMIFSLILIIYYVRYDWISLSLMVIYLAWLIFALYLNWYALRHNLLVVNKVAYDFF